MSPRLDTQTLRLPRSAAADEEIVAIGDIHGRVDLFEALLEAAASLPKRALSRRLVLLGDLIDRGPNSLAVIRSAAEAADRIGADALTPLMGNHESLMRLSLDPNVPFAVALEALPTWARNGGTAVINEIWPQGFTERDLAAVAARLRQTVPTAILEWLRGLASHTRSGGLLFVHGGVNPRRDLETFLATPWDTPLSRLDEEEHWAWVRKPFLTHRPGPQGFSGYFCVHGHSPRDIGATRSHADQIARFRLNLDGGSAMTGEAKLARIVGDEAEVVTARA